MYDFFLTTCPVWIYVTNIGIIGYFYNFIVLGLGHPDFCIRQEKSFTNNNTGCLGKFWM